MKPTLVFFLLMACSPYSRADLIADWNKTGVDYLSQHAINHAARGMTTMHVAQFDAINAVTGGYVPYLIGISAPGASPEAAASQAAYSILTNISRAGLGTLNTALQRSLENIPEGPAKEAGLQLGRFAAEQYIQLRAADNPNLPINTTNSTVVGKWRTVPPGVAPGVGANARYMQPWTMQSVSQFRPPPPPALTSERYAADFEEVRLLGARGTNTTRTADQAEAANFHFGDDQALLRPVLERSTLPLLESARALALYYMAGEDSVNAMFEAQYAHNHWRPYSAIRLAANDGNDLTTAVSNWTPFLDTPNHPEYPSGTCTATASIVEVLTTFYGDDFSLTGTVVTDRPHSRFLPRLSAATNDAVIARIAAGAHFRFSCLAGLELGKKVAQNALANFLRPVPRLAAAPGARPAEFQLNLATGNTHSLVIQTSNDLLQWNAWRTNTYGVLSFPEDDILSSQHKFFRAIRQ